MGALINVCSRPAPTFLVLQSQQITIIFLVFQLDPINKKKKKERPSLHPR